jgi:hypothetical protein
VVVVTKTDANGHWTYTLDKPLVDGQHTVYAALTNSDGEIQARSEVMVFMKNGNNVTRAYQEASIAASTKKLQNNFAIAIFFIVGLAVGAAILVIGFAAARANRGGGKGSGVS